MTNLELMHDKFNQSPWLDNLSREMLNNGSIQKLIDQGVRGLTSNPTIFEKALSDSTAYDEAIKDKKRRLQVIKKRKLKVMKKCLFCKYFMADSSGIPCSKHLVSFMRNKHFVLNL